MANTSLSETAQRTKLEQLDGMALPGGPCPEHDAGTCGPRSSLSTQCYNAKDFAASAVDEPDAVHQFFLHASDSAKMHGLASGDLFVELRGKVVLTPRPARAPGPVDRVRQRYGVGLQEDAMPLCHREPAPPDHDGASVSLAPTGGRAGPQSAE